MLIALSSADFFKLNFFGKNLSRMLSVSNRLDPDQTQRVVGPDLGPNCLNFLSADDTSRLTVNFLNHKAVSGKNAFIKPGL